MTQVRLLKTGLLLLGVTIAAGETSVVAMNESICGVGEEVVSTQCLGESLVKSQARATAKMIMGGCCTAWLVKGATSGKGALMLTTGHCAAKTTATFIFEYATACGAPSGGSQDKSCTGVRVSAETFKDEQGIYELQRPCEHADAATPILLDVGIPDEGEGMYLIGHPKCLPQVLSHQEAHDDGHHCEIRTPSFHNSAGSKRSSYYCDTQGGNSGSPVFSARTGYAFAIHSHGGCNGRQSSANSGGLLANSGVISAFDEFQIPYVNRDTSDLMKYDNFVEETQCLRHEQLFELPQKTLAECKALCVNSLTCVGVEHSASQGICLLNYRSDVTPSFCPGSSKYFSRPNMLTVKLIAGGIVTTTPKPLTPSSGFCGFESSSTPYCGIWRDSSQDKFDWTRTKGGTPSRGTGPSSANGGDYYVYTEVSSPIASGDDAILEALTPTLNPGSFLSFFYHMHGASSMGVLRVVARSMETGSTDELWSKSGNQGDQWIPETISLDVFSGKSVVISFVGNKANSWQGDIAIDDVMLSAGAATSPTSTTSATAPATTKTVTTTARLSTTTTTTTVTTTTATTITTTSTTTATMTSTTSTSMTSTTVATSIAPTTTATPTKGTTTSAPGGATIQSGDIVFLSTRSGTGFMVDIEGTTVQSRWVGRGNLQAITIEKPNGGGIASGDVVYLKTQTGAHMDVEGESVHARWNDMGDWQAMRIEKRTGMGPIHSDDLICFRALRTGKHLDVEAAVVRARWEDCGEWQTMRIEKEVADAVFSGNSITLLAHTGKRIEVEGTAVGGRWGEAGAWQTFGIMNYGGRTIFSGDAVFLQAHTGMMVDVQGVAVQARWNSMGQWQKLTIEKTQGGGAILPGDAVFLRAHTGKRIEVDGNIVQARFTEPGTWQTLVVERKVAQRRMFEIAVNTLPLGVGALCPVFAVGLGAFAVAATLALMRRRQRVIHKVYPIHD